MRSSATWGMGSERLARMTRPCSLGGRPIQRSFPGSALDDWVSYGVGRRRKLQHCRGHDAAIGADSIIAPGIQLGASISRGKRILFGVCSNVL